MTDPDQHVLQKDLEINHEDYAEIINPVRVRFLEFTLNFHDSLRTEWALFKRVHQSHINAIHYTSAVMAKRK